MTHETNEFDDCFGGRDKKKSSSVSQLAGKQACKTCCPALSTMQVSSSSFKNLHLTLLQPPQHIQSYNHHQIANFFFLIYKPTVVLLYKNNEAHITTTTMPMENSKECSLWC